MMRYRNTRTGEIWTEDELSASLAQQIAALDEDSYLRQDMKLRGNEAIRDYIIECCLVGIYQSADDE
jgi:hypothetical protein